MAQHEVEFLLPSQYCLFSNNKHLLKCFIPHPISLLIKDVIYFIYLEL